MAPFAMLIFIYFQREMFHPHYPQSLQVILINIINLLSNVTSSALRLLLPVA